jgi:hypothetical protein
MQKRVLFLIFFLVLIGSVSFAQESVNVAASRNKQIHDLLDYRFRGGFYSFERVFLQTVKYTDVARQNCVIGIMVVTFQVSCEGTVRDVRIKNPLNYGINEQIVKFMKATKGQWNNCHNNKYTKFAIPIQFTMVGTKTDSLDAVISLVGKNPGYVCNSDDYYLRKAKEALAKKKGKRARSYIEILIRRNPFNNDYFDMMKQSLNLSGKKKKKKKK